MHFGTIFHKLFNTTTQKKKKKEKEVISKRKIRGSLTYDRKSNVPKKER